MTAPIGSAAGAKWDKAKLAGAQLVGAKLVGAARFELAAFGSQNRRATRLRYAPTPPF